MVPKSGRMVSVTYRTRGVCCDCVALCPFTVSLYYAALFPCTLHRFTVLRCTASLYYAALLHCTMLHCFTVLRCTVLPCTAQLYYTALLHCTTLHCFTVLHCTASLYYAALVNLHKMQVVDRGTPVILVEQSMCLAVQLIKCTARQCSIFTARQCSAVQ